MSRIDEIKKRRTFAIISHPDAKHIEDSYNAACEVAKKYNWYTVECVNLLK